MTARDERVSTGVAGLDTILGGSLPANRTYLVQGQAGTGKTTLALQFLLAGVRQGEPGLYVTLSETETELHAVAQSHGWSLQGVAICDLQTQEQTLKPDTYYTLFHPSDVELSATTKTVMAAVDELKPRRIVFDSLSDMRLLARDSLRYRRQILGLKHYFAARRCTVLLLDIPPHEAHDFQLETLVHGVINLSQEVPEYGTKRRRLSVQKMRGVVFREGTHDCAIRTGGLVVWPRLEADTALPEPAPARAAQLPQQGRCRLGARGRPAWHPRRRHHVAAGSQLHRGHRRPPAVLRGLRPGPPGHLGRQEAARRSPAHDP